MTTTPQTEAQRLAASISETLDSQDDSYLTCSVTKCLLQQAATELLRLDAKHFAIDRSQPNERQH